MKFIYVLRDLLALFLIGLLSYFSVLFIGKDVLRLANQHVAAIMELASIVFIGLYMWLMHNKNVSILIVMQITLLLFGILILTGLSGNLINVIFLAAIVLLTITINLYNPKKEKKPLPVAKEPTDSNKIVSELKKEKKTQKEFDGSDHNRFKPK